MNERIEQLAKQANADELSYAYYRGEKRPENAVTLHSVDLEKFAELIVREMCGMMEQAEDDGYHCFEASERPTEYIEWLRDWQERFTKHFGVEE